MSTPKSKIELFNKLFLAVFRQKPIKKGEIFLNGSFSFFSHLKKNSRFDLKT